MKVLVANKRRNVHRQSKQYNHFPGKTKKKGIIIIVKIFICTVRCSTIQYCRVNLQAGVLPLLSFLFSTSQNWYSFLSTVHGVSQNFFLFFLFFLCFVRSSQKGGGRRRLVSSLSKRALFNIRLEQFSNIFKNPHCFPGGAKEVERGKRGREERS